MKRLIFALTVFLLAAAYVQSGNIKQLDSTVGTLAANAVDSTKVIDGSLSGADLGADVIDSTKIRALSIATSDIETFATAKWDSAYAIADRDTVLINGLRISAEADTSNWTLGYIWRNKLSLSAALPDTTGYLGGEMWLSATGDSIYIYKSDHTIISK